MNYQTTNKDDILEILILMAGDGTRFKKEGIFTPKPMFKVNGKSILEWTTRSFPFIQHYKEQIPIKYNLSFAIREEHNKNNNLIEMLKKIYGNTISFKIFPSLTKGNLETAFLSITKNNLQRPLLILDADNKFDGSEFLSFVSKINVKDNFASLCCFEPKDDSEKWCFVSFGPKNIVENISEKKRIQNGKPMVGVFYYSSKKLFIDSAKKILTNKQMVKNEFYMSQTFTTLLLEKTPIYAHTVENVVPLGTPQDVERFKNENLL